VRLSFVILVDLDLDLVIENFGLRLHTNSQFIRNAQQCC